jgi:Protein of unknown function (DUF2690)
MLREKVQAVSANYMPAIRRVLLVLALVAGLVLPISVFSAAPASAGTCSGAGCDSQDPQSTGCAADAINAAVTSEGGVTLQLRYSPSCHANWARMLPGQFGWHFTVYNANGAQHDSTGFGQDSTWTAMVDGNVKAEACFDNGNCTGWV